MTLGEGWTPLLRARRLGKKLGLDRLYVKDESLNPTQSFKARGLSAAVTRALHLGAKALSIPTAGNAGNAMAAYAARAGMSAHVYMPKDVKTPFIRECELYGANVTLVDGLITDAGKIAAEEGKKRDRYDMSTLKEPYRIEGKKTMGYEIAEQLDWQLPDWILYPPAAARGWSACGRRSPRCRRSAGSIRWAPAHGDGAGGRLRADRARVRRRRREGGAVGRRAHHCRRAARARAIGDFLMLRAVRESGGAAVAVGDGDGRRHERSRQARRHQRRARGRRRAARAARAGVRRAHQAMTRSSSSTPAAH